MAGRIGIDDVAPVVSAGRYPAKAVVGEVVPVKATVWREGHDAVAATLVVRYHGTHYPQITEGPAQEPAAPAVPIEAVVSPATKVKPQAISMAPGRTPDVFHGVFSPDRVGLWTFRVDGWGDPIATWRKAVTAKLDAGQSESELSNDLIVGARLLERAATGVPRTLRDPLIEAAELLRKPGDPFTRAGAALSAEVTELLAQYPLRDQITRGEQHGVWVDRPAARFSAWYECFRGRPEAGTRRATRSTARSPPRRRRCRASPRWASTWCTCRRSTRSARCTARAPIIQSPPHPRTSDPRGRSAVTRAATTPCIPSSARSRTSTLSSPQRRDQGMEVALDLALQAAPDHPWAKTNPEWFTVLPDGTIAYAENPPKKYQDIYPINFDNDPAGIYNEVLRVVRYWISHGVKIFRVDNPHTKPPNFWAWLIGQVKAADPDVLFLAEAFTRPARLYGLAKLGFTQSYSYFTWRTAKWELIEFGEQIVEHADYARPNLFVNTPDILHESLQHGGPGMFAIRAVLASTFSPAWGVYSGYELFEHRPVREGSEEYLDSEKYEFRPRDFEAALARGESLEPFLGRLNEIRRIHPALREMRTLKFHHVDNDALLAYSKFDPITGDAVLVVVTLNPFGAEEATVWLDMAALGMQPYDRFWVRDEISGDEYQWGQSNYVRLDPGRAVAHVFNMPQIPPEQRQILLRRE